MLKAFAKDIISLTPIEIDASRLKKLTMPPALPPNCNPSSLKVGMSIGQLLKVG
jgi:hypothetical protein